MTIHSVHVTHYLTDVYDIHFKTSLFQTEGLQPAQLFIIWNLSYNFATGQPHKEQNNLKPKQNLTQTSIKQANTLYNADKARICRENTVCISIFFLKLVLFL